MSDLDVKELIDSYGESAIYNSLYKHFGYKEPIPTIDEFIESPRYLGNLTDNGARVYPFWRKMLNKIYPTPYSTKYHSVLLRGAIGTGKSNTAKIMASYNLCRMLCMDDPRGQFNLGSTTYLELFGYAATLELVNGVFLREFVDILRDSPFFKDKFNNVAKSSMFKDKIDLSVGTTVTHNVGKAIFCSVFEEIQREVRHDQLRENYYSILQRIKSRFEVNGQLREFCQIIMVGSAGANESFAEALTEQARKDNDTGVLILDPPQWEVLAKDPVTGRGKTEYVKPKFKVFIGDDTRDPFIIDDTYPPEFIATLDPERVLLAPGEVKDSFEKDIYQAIMDIAGVTTRSQFRFFQSMAKVNPVMQSLGWFDSDCIKVSFYNKNDKIADKMNKERFLNRKNPAVSRYIHIDIGYASDRTGITCLHISGSDNVKRSNLINNTYQTIKEPIITCDFILGIERMPNEEVPIFKIKEFLFDLASMGVPIGGVSADGFQSKQLMQELQASGFNTAYVSVDRTMEAYQCLKLTFYEERIHGCKNDIALKEISELQTINASKVDHPPEGCLVGYTPIMTDSGSIPISELRPEHKVYAYNTKNRTFETTDYTNLRVTRMEQEIYRIETEDGIIECTGNHPILTTKGYIRADQLTLEDEIVCKCSDEN